MPRVKVSSIGVSLDGFGAGPAQSLEHPLGVGGAALMEWAIGRHMFGTALDMHVVLTKRARPG